VHHTGVGKTALTTAIATAEDEGWLLVDHGVDCWQEEDARANQYRVTSTGRDQIPAVLRSLSGDYSVSQPVWAEKGGHGLRGLMLVLTHPYEVTAQQAAALWGTTVGAASDRLRRMASAENPLVVQVGGRWRVMPMWGASNATEARYDQREEARVVDLLVARLRVSRPEARVHLQTIRAFKDFEDHDDAVTPERGEQEA
jgi:hypothetical protein